MHRVVAGGLEGALGPLKEETPLHGGAPQLETASNSEVWHVCMVTCYFRVFS